MWRGGYIEDTGRYCVLESNLGHVGRRLPHVDDRLVREPAAEEFVRLRPVDGPTAKGGGERSSAAHKVAVPEEGGGGKEGRGGREGMR